MIRKPWYAFVMVLALSCANLHAYLHLTGEGGEHFTATEQSPCVLASVTATPAVAPCLVPLAETVVSYDPRAPEPVWITRIRTYRVPRGPPSI